MRNRGYTLLELLVVVAVGALVAAGAGVAFVSGISFNERLREARSGDLERIAFERRLSLLLRGAYVSTAGGDTSTCFISNVGSETEITDTGAASSLTFTSLSERVLIETIGLELDFEQLNEQFGPQGGVAEMSLATTAVGQTDRTGLFLRIQRPADGDFTQGGSEKVLTPFVSQISFEFFDGLEWRTNWDTRTQGIRRLPSLVRVTFRWDEEETDRVLLVRLPNSDATPERPVEVNA